MKKLSLFFALATVALSAAAQGVFVRGAHNSWGANAADEMTLQADGTYTIENYTITGQFKIADASWSAACNYGASGDGGLVVPGTPYTLTLGSNDNLTVAERTVCTKITFDPSVPSVLLEAAPEAPVALAGIALWPAEATLLTAQPAQVKVLSMNNSLIHYEQEWQDDIFNQMATAMGRNASWTAHTNLGKTLQYHFEEEGATGARAVVAGDTWTHIILQEQTAKPRTNFAGFRESVSAWVEYIRANCPNPNAVIILPINWAYNTDPFTTFNATFLENYRKVAQEFGVVLCPVGPCYQYAYERDDAILSKWFKDDRHPTTKATYAACCLEFATIFGVDPATITWAPSTLAADDASTIRSYASAVWQSFEQVVDQHAHTVRYQLHQLDENGMSAGVLDAASYAADRGTMQDSTLTATAAGTYNVSALYEGATYTAVLFAGEAVSTTVDFPAVLFNETDTAYVQDFDCLGGDDVDPSTDAKTGIKRGSTLPQGWKIEKNISGPRTIGTIATAADTTTYIGGQSLASNAYNGIWNLGATGSTDRAIGGMTTGVSNGTRTINLMAHLENNGDADFSTLAISYDIEKYRSGNNSAGFTIQLYTSRNGYTWTSAGAAFRTLYTAESATAGYATVPALVIPVADSLAIQFKAGESIYLCWSISATSGDNCAGAPAFGIDNVSITACREAASTADATATPAIELSEENHYYMQDFDCLGGADVDPSTDAKTGIKRGSTLPQGWRVERNQNGPRQSGSYLEASDTTQYIGGQSLASNAYNGTWNLGGTGSTDRAIGGMTTSVDGGARTINVMAHVKNAGAADCPFFHLSYSIEKYRSGANNAGFTIQLLTSADGINWTSAGDDFKTAYTAESTTAGYATVPAAEIGVEGNLAGGIKAGEHLFLCWQIAVSSGADCAKAPAFGIDDVRIELHAPSTAVENASADATVSKRLIDGQLIIEKNGQRYNALGQQL